MGTAEAAITHRPEYQLFDSRAVGLVAFICGPLPGAVLIAVNYVRLGKDGKGVLAFIVGLTATALIILTRWDWQSSVAPLGSDALAILFIICTWLFAKKIQGKVVEEHVARGGKLGATSTAFFIGIATMAGVLAVIVAAFYNPKPKAVVIGARDQVLYSGIMATQKDATALANALKSAQYFQDRGASVLLNKGLGGTIISFVVQDGVWDRAGTPSVFEEIAREVAPAVGGLPVQVRLLDSQMDVEETLIVGEVRFGGANGVYYEGSATKAEAKALGQQLKSMGFFRGKGANVFLSKHPDGTILAFVVTIDNVLDNPKIVSEFEAIVRDVAPAVGGLPIEMHIVNRQLQLEKDEVIK